MGKQHGAEQLMHAVGFMVERERPRKPPKPFFRATGLHQRRGVGLRDFGIVRRELCGAISLKTP